MRIAYIILCAALAYLPGSAIAGQTLLEPHAVLYYQIPFGGTRSESRHSFGMRVDQTLVTRGETIQFRTLMSRPALFEFRAGYEGIQSFTIAGTNYAQRFRAHRQNDGGEGLPEAEEAPAEETAETAGEPEEEYVYEDPGPTLSEILDEAEPGWLIGGVLGVVLLTGVLD